MRKQFVLNDASLQFTDCGTLLVAMPYETCTDPQCDKAKAEGTIILEHVAARLSHILPSCAGLP